MLLTLVLFLGESHGLYRPRGHKELDTTEQLSLSHCFLCSLCVISAERDWRLTQLSKDGASDKEPAFQYSRRKRHRIHPWVRKMPWGRAWQPLRYSCLENFMDRGA